MNEHTQIRNTALIAVVDDDDSVRSALEGLLRSSGYKARSYCSALEFLATGVFDETDCLISDIQMPGMTGLEMHKQLIAKGLQIPTIFITAYPVSRPDHGAHSPNLIACLPKPCDADRLLQCIETALAH